MEELNQQALLKARSMISTTFVSPSSLDELSALSLQLEKQLASAEGQLNSAVQGKLDSLKRAVDLMDESAVKLSTMSTKINKIDERIAQTNTAISNYECLSRLDFARDNLQKVISQVEFFAKVPERVQYLRGLLDEDQSNLREVYLEGLKLDSLKTALMKEAKVSRGKRKSVVIRTPPPSGSSGAAGAGSPGDGAYSDETYKRIQRSIEQHLRIVPELVLEVKQRVLQNVDNMWEVADACPADLVSTFEIVEMQHEYNQRRIMQIHLRLKQINYSLTPAEGSSATERRTEAKPVGGGGGGSGDRQQRQLQQQLEQQLQEFEDIRETVLVRIKDNFEQIVLSEFEPVRKRLLKAALAAAESSAAGGDGGKGKGKGVGVMTERRSKEKRDSDDEDESEKDDQDEDEEDEEEEKKVSIVTTMLAAANQVIQAIMVFRNSILVCMPPDYNGMELFLDAFDDVLRDQLNIVVADYSDLKVSDLLELINWIEYHHVIMEDFRQADREICTDLSNLKTELLMEYKNQIKLQVHQWFLNIKKQQLEVVQAANGTLVTSSPEDMFNIIHMQVSVAREKLPAEYSKEVAVACLQVLQDVQRQLYDSLSAEWRQMDAETMCATINDSQRMREKCAEFGEELLRFVGAAQEREMLQAVHQEVSRQYLQLALKAVTFVARVILEDLDDRIFARLFSPEWESGSEQVAATLAATLQDYFSDLSSWLSRFYFSCFVKEILQRISTTYVMSIRRRANPTYSFVSEQAAANVVLSDRAVLEEIFEAFQSNLAEAAAGKMKNGPADIDPSGRSDNPLESIVIGEVEDLFEEDPMTAAFAPFKWLSDCIRARAFSAELEDDVEALCRNYGIDGLKVAQSALSCNPMVGKIEKLQNIETARKIYEANAAAAGTDQTAAAEGGKYCSKPMEEFVTYDAFNFNQTGGGSISASASSAVRDTVSRTKATTSNFWGRGNNKR